MDDQLDDTIWFGRPSTASEAAMSFDPTERRQVGRRDVSVTRLGLGGASIGGLFEATDEQTAIDTVDRAWELGVRLFDTAPLYGYGNSERRMGRALSSRPRGDYVLSTKVGRLIRAAGRIPAGAEVDRQAFGGRENAFYHGTGDVRPVFDYSADGVRRSIEESLERLGIGRIDIALIHDPDDHWAEAIGQAYPALHRLREEGVVRAIGAGMNQSAMLARFLREGDFDVVMLAGRYTLLDQEGLTELLPLCLERGVGVLVAGVMNSGILTRPNPGATFNYVPAPEPIVERARRIEAVCARHRIALRHAAVQFPLAHPAVTALVAGVRRIHHLEEYPELMRSPIPDGLWDELRHEGLLAADAPTPSQGAA
jgi:D-threo-aldose 1-dehydrogenase